MLTDLKAKCMTSELFLKDYHDIFVSGQQDVTITPVSVSKKKFPFIFQIGACCRVSDHLQYCIYDEQN